MEMLADLINLAQRMLESGFDIQVFQGWEFLAFLALLTTFGPFHYYTQHFRRLTSERNQQALLAGEGLLIAAKEILSQQESLKADQMGSNSHMRAQYSGLLHRLQIKLCEFLSKSVNSTPGEALSLPGEQNTVSLTQNLVQNQRTVQS